MVCFREGGGDFARLGECGERVGCSPERAEHEPVADSIGRDCGLGGDGASQQLLGSGEVSFLLADEAEQIKGVGMLRLRGENLFVERSGFAHASGAVMLQREL